MQLFRSLSSVGKKQLAVGDIFSSIPAVIQFIKGHIANCILPTANFHLKLMPNKETNTTLYLMPLNI